MASLITDKDMQIYLFNPDADMALADNRPAYVAPETVRQMSRDLALLPFWYAGGESGVCVASEDESLWVERMNGRFRRNIVPVLPKERQRMAEAEWMPWGWTPALRRRLMEEGTDEARLPCEEALAEWRGRASRERVSAWLEDLGEVGGGRAESVNLRDLSACRAYVEEHRAVVFKGPWSGSGKGLRWCREAFTPDVAGWCARLLRKHGLVTASPVYDKVEDLALEFYADGQGSFRFEGYSLFATTSGGAYAGNWVLADERVEQLMESYGLGEALRRVRARVLEIAAYHIGSYRGYWGIDMMVCRDSATGLYWLHPCVEVNLRMNMGVVALKLRQCLLASGRAGRLRIDYLPMPGAMYARHVEDEKRYPLRVEQGRVEEGYLALVPVTPESRYRAALYVGSVSPSAGRLSLP